MYENIFFSKKDFLVFVNVSCCEESRFLGDRFAVWAYQLRNVSRLIYFMTLIGPRGTVHSASSKEERIERVVGCVHDQLNGA